MTKLCSSYCRKMNLHRDTSLNRLNNYWHKHIAMDRKRVRKIAIEMDRFLEKGAYFVDYVDLSGAQNTVDGMAFRIGVHRSCVEDFGTVNCGFFRKLRRTSPREFRAFERALEATGHTDVLGVMTTKE